jgi:RNA polymerase sigma-70 factor (ECF subfamily)
LSHNADSTAALLSRIRAGDGSAREELAGRYLTALRRWAHGRLPHAARDLVDTDDLVQSALVRALHRLESFEPRGEGAFFAYLRKILVNRIRDETRRASRRPPHLELHEDHDAGGHSPLDELIGRQNVERYEAALERLTTSQKEAVILRIEFGFRYREIAEAIGASTPNAARLLVGRGLVHLSQMMRAEP